MNALAEPDPGQAAAALLDLYDEALPQVHGYLLRRCRGRLVAEELTSEVFLAAVRAVRVGTVERVTVAWLIGIARHKLVDHWRAQEREQRRLRAVAGELDRDGTEDHWDDVLDRHVAEEILAGLAPQYRAALTLRYLDALPVAQVAEHLERGLGATEALLTRSKAAFRQAYQLHGGQDV